MMQILGAMGGEEYRIADPNWLWLLVVIPLAIIYRWKRPQRVLVVPFAASWQSGHRTSYRGIMSEIMVTMGLILLPFALSRPQRITYIWQDRKQVFDIMLAIDISGSMNFRDYPGNAGRSSRLDAVKTIVDQFVERRRFDHIGLVVFDGSAYTLQRPTLNHRLIRDNVGLLRAGLGEEGTAIGNGVALSVERLKESLTATPPPRDRFIILFSDGRNNAGFISLAQAVSFARVNNTRIYTVAVAGDCEIELDRYGAKDVYHVAEAEADEGALWLIARDSGGNFYSCKNFEKLEEALDSVDAEKKGVSKIRRKSASEELYQWILIPSLILVLAGAFSESSTRRW